MKIIFITVLFLLGFNVVADSYDDSLKELFELTSIKNEYLDLNNLIINQMQVGFFQAADQNINGDSLTEEQKTQVGEMLKNRFTEMVKNYQVHIQESMPYEKLEKEVYIPLYKETYTEDEIKELIVFYKTPVGEKSIEASQSISQQAAQQSAEKYNSTIVDFVKQQIDENIKLVQKEMADQGIK